MARNLQVILRGSVSHLGDSGDVVKVRPGYARNFLIPRGLAVVASRANVKTIEHEKQLALVRLEQRRKEAQEAAKRFKGLTLHVAKQVADPEEGKLFGSVTLTDILEALGKKGFGDIDKRNVLLPEEPIHFTGSYEIHVRLAPGVEAPVKLEVKTAS